MTKAVSLLIRASDWNCVCKKLLPQRTLPSRDPAERFLTLEPLPPSPSTTVRAMSHLFQITSRQNLIVMLVVEKIEKNCGYFGVDNLGGINTSPKNVTSDFLVSWWQTRWRHDVGGFYVGNKDCVFDHLVNGRVSCCLWSMTMLINSI